VKPARRKSQIALPHFKLEHSEKIEITANAGMFLLAEFLKTMKVVEAFAQLKLYHRQTIGEAVHVLALVINHFTGGEAIYDTQYVKADSGLCALFGDLHIPAPTTSGDFLERFTKEAVERLRQILHAMQNKRLKKLSKQLKRRIVISMDSSLYEVHGDCKEQSSQSYKNIFGFHPLFLHIHNTGELLDVIFRSGKEFTSTGAAQMLEENVQRLKPYFDEIILLADSGFFEASIVNTCEKPEVNINYIITCELNAPIKRRLLTPELKWATRTEAAIDAPAETVARDSHSIDYRLQALKEALNKRGKALKVRGPMEVTEFEHRVAAWDRTVRAVFKRQRILEQNLTTQEELFEATETFFYHGYVTNLRNKSLHEILTLIDSRGHQENFIKDFKQGLGTVHIPVKHFYGNYAYFLIAMFSWNLKLWLMRVIEPDLNLHWKRFRYLFIKVGAQIIKSGRYIVVRFGKGFERIAEFARGLTRLERLART
jgi:hypothetical protein